MAQAGALWVAPGVSIPRAEIGIEFTRSGGPGGQRVNKAETCAIVRFRPEASSASEKSSIALSPVASMAVMLRRRSTTTGVSSATCATSLVSFSVAPSKRHGQWHRDESDREAGHQVRAEGVS